MPRAEPPFPQAGVRRTVAEKQEYFFPLCPSLGIVNLFSVLLVGV